MVSRRITKNLDGHFFKSDIDAVCRVHDELELEKNIDGCNFLKYLVFFLSLYREPLVRDRRLLCVVYRPLKGVRAVAQDEGGQEG